MCWWFIVWKVKKKKSSKCVVGLPALQSCWCERNDGQKKKKKVFLAFTAMEIITETVSNTSIWKQIKGRLNWSDHFCGSFQVNHRKCFNSLGLQLNSFSRAVSLLYCAAHIGGWLEFMLSGLWAHLFSYLALNLCKIQAIVSKNAYIYDCLLLSVSYS